MIFLGTPMLLLEMTLGQYSALAPTKLYRNLCPVSFFFLTFFSFGFFFCSGESFAEFMFAKTSSQGVPRFV